MLTKFVLASSLLLCASALTAEELAMFKPRDPDHTDPNTGKKAEVWARDNGDGSQTIYTNGIPSHETWTFPHDTTDNPNSVEESVVEMKIYSTPIMREKPMRCTPPGHVGIATSGTVIYNWFPAEEGCPDVKEFEELDICEGHPSPNNQYHYHYYSPCVQMPVCGEPSPIYGVALDGIPIYGPFDETGRQLTSSDLDECGGRTDADGRYKYHVVADPTYFIGCFSGEIRSDSGKNIGAYICACPFDDSGYVRNERGPRPGPRPDDGGAALPDDGGADGGGNTDDAGHRTTLESVCTANEEDPTQPITCRDEEYLAELEYEIPYVWKPKSTEIDLIPCCPENTDCGTSCKTEDGIKSECFVEKRTVPYLTREARGTSSTAGHSSRGKGGMIFIGITFILPLARFQLI